MNPTRSAARGATLRGFPLFASLDATRVDRLAETVLTATVSHGDALWSTGEAATRFTLIQSGLVKVVRALPDGSETIVGLFGPRESVGDAAVVARGTYPGTAVAASRTVTVLRVDAAPLFDAARSDPAVFEAIQRALLAHTQALQEKIAVLSAGTVDRRLAMLLLVLAERFGDEGESGELLLPVALSRQELGRLIAATPETVIRTMSRWQKEGWVETGSDGFVIGDPSALRRIQTGAPGREST